MCGEPNVASNADKEVLGVSVCRHALTLKSMQIHKRIISDLDRLLPNLYLPLFHAYDPITGLLLHRTPHHFCFPVR